MGPSVLPYCVDPDMVRYVARPTAMTDTAYGKMQITQCGFAASFNHC